MITQPGIAPVRRPFTVAEYEQLGHIGVLGPDERVELLNGDVVVMSPIGPPHAGRVDRLNHLLVSRLGDRAVVRIQNPLRLTLHSEPEPDVVLARPRADFYMTSHPGPGDAQLVIEVSDTSLLVDRGIKVPLYAEAAVAEVWIIDIEANAIHVHRKPDGSGYTDTQTMRSGDQLSPIEFPDLTFDVGDLLGQ